MDKFRDPIHGFIEVREHELEIINTKPFQRLRNIKQLAMTYYVYQTVFHTKVHPQEPDEREFNRNLRELKGVVGEENLFTDKSAGKMPHKIPKKIEIDNEKAIIIYEPSTERKTTISEESDIIRNLTEKINIMRIYCAPEKSEIAFNKIKEYNEITEG